jgi:hypothetical protein
VLYFCVENDHLISVLEYLPSVPDTVSVVKVNAEQQEKLDAKTHYFDPKTLKIRPYTDSELQAIQSKNLVSRDTGPYTLPLNGSLTPLWANGKLEFVLDKTNGDANLIVINTTGRDMIVSASTTVGSFTEILVKTDSKYSAAANDSPTPIGFAVFRAGN